MRLSDSSAVRALAFSPDGILAAASAGGQVTLWDLATRTVRRTFVNPHDVLETVAVSPNGRLLAYAGDRGSITLVDRFSGRRKVLAVDTGRIFSLAFNARGSLLASGGDDRTIRIWRVDTGAEVSQLTGASDAVFSVAFSPGGKVLASGSADDTVRLWDISRHRQLGQPMIGHHGYVWSVAFNKDGSILASASEDGTIRFWDVASRTAIGLPMTSDSQRIRSVTFSPTAEALISGGADGAVRMWPVVKLPGSYEILAKQGVLAGRRGAKR